MRTITVFRNNRCGLQYLLIQNPFLRPNSLAKIWSARSVTSRSIFGGSYSLKLLGSNPFRPSGEGFESGRRWKQQSLTRKVDPGNNYTTESSKSYTHRPDDLLTGIVSAANVVNMNKSDQCDAEGIKYLDAHETNESRDCHQLVTILVFDIETTGFNKKDDSIIEFAVQDLRGGENSTFQTLINPDRSVLNTECHNITTDMVNRPEVPRFKDMIPILRDYVRTRQKIPHSPVLLVAHNAWRFDVPFLVIEFKRCSEEIPSDWLFLDTLPLACELAKLEGSKLLSKKLEDLREFYGIPLVGKAHRAMSDVYSLSKVLQALTMDLKLPLSSLLDRSFKASDPSNLKKTTKKKTKKKKISLS